MDEELEIYRKGYGTIFSYHIDTVIDKHTTELYQETFLDVGSLMLLGMALFKLGVLTGQRSQRFYLWLGLISYSTVTLIRLPVINSVVVSEFDPNITFGLYSLTYANASIILAIGHLGMVMYLSHSRYFHKVQTALAEVGRLALSHYLGQTIFAIFLFYGIGATTFADFERYQLIFIVIGLWVFQIGFSHFWLSYYRIGPVEWLWRSLIYIQIQPLSHKKQSINRLY